MQTSSILICVAQATLACASVLEESKHRQECRCHTSLVPHESGHFEESTGRASVF